MSAVVIGKVDGRISLRCDSCKLIQFQTISGTCRKCGSPFEEEPPEEPIPVPIEVERDMPWDHPRTVVEALPLVLRSVRLHLGISQSAFAKRCGWARTYMTKLETGSSCPTISNLWRIAEGLGLEGPALLRLCEVAAGKP